MEQLSELKQELSQVQEELYRRKMEEAYKLLSPIQKLIRPTLVKEGGTISLPDPFTNLYSIPINDLEFANKEICTIYITQDWGRDATRTYTGFEFNYYSTSIKLPDPFQVKRFKIMSELIAILSGDVSDVLRKMNEVDVEYTKKKEPLYERQHKLETQIQRLTKEDKENAFYKWLETLFTTGLTFKERKTIKIGYNQDRWFNEIKITDWTASGKTATVQTVYHSPYEFEGGRRPSTVKVKKEYLLDLYNGLLRDWQGDESVDPYGRSTMDGIEDLDLITNSMEA